MARRRMITSDIWNDEKIARLDKVGRLVFIGLITLANDYGKLRGNPALIATMLFPYDSDKVNIAKYLSELSRHKCITLYKVNGEQFIFINKWFKHQTLTYKGKDTLPAVPVNTLKRPLSDKDKGHLSKIREFSEVEFSSKECSLDKQRPGTPAEHQTTLSLAEREKLEKVKAEFEGRRKK